LREYRLQANVVADFEPQWGSVARQIAGRAGCAFVRLHRDNVNAGHYLGDEAWRTRQNLIAALSTTDDPAGSPGSGDLSLPGQSSLIFVQLKRHIPGAQSDIVQAASGQVASVRVFSIKVGAEGQFERLWTQSAQAEAHQIGCLFKRLYADLNLPTRYVSYSLWADATAPEEAASKHTHWQKQHPPYPLGSPVIRAYYEVRANVIGSE
ncbi:MAG TPA: antibiotic biosynthesis monooxygenase family protein, partial [Aggregatilineales bacterium]|nr:antibiotic biosynthesis monooxygenase family protein [Aggregatilineales bacterium]